MTYYYSITFIAALPHATPPLWVPLPTAHTLPRAHAPVYHLYLFTLPIPLASCPLPHTPHHIYLHTHRACHTHTTYTFTPPRTPLPHTLLQLPHPAPHTLPPHITPPHAHHPHTDLPNIPLPYLQHYPSPPDCGDSHVYPHLGGGVPGMCAQCGRCVPAGGREEGG